MNNLMKHMELTVVALIAAVSLTACGGGGGSSSTPTTVPNSATVFYAHSLIFRNHTTLAAGYNAFGQLGTDNLGNRTTPTAVKNGLFFGGVAAGSNHSVAFYNNSTVRSWGYNGFGQLGNNSTTYSSVPVKTTTTATTGGQQLSGVKEVAAGSMHSLARRNDGTVWAWGQNTYGQLGVPTTVTGQDGYSKIALPVEISGAPLKNIVAIAAYGHHSLALDSSGTVWAWGLNGSGQLGIDPVPTGALAVPTPVAGLSPNVIVAIAAGGASSYAIDTNGNLWAWGNAFNGQLGNGSTQDSYAPVQVLKGPGDPLTGVVKVSAGIQHCLAMLASGEVWAWGYNIYGQLGNNDTNKLDKSYAVRVVADAAGNPFTGATDIRAFGSSSMAQNSSGWYGWGDNAYGQLGTGNTGTLLVPAKSGF